MTSGASLPSCVPLNNGTQMPRIGLGTWRLDGRAGEKAVEQALDIGYRSIDTAAQYGNEEAVGRAARRSGVPREDLFVTTKLGNGEHRFADALRAFDASLQRLQMDYVDLYLIHWPLPAQGRTSEAWHALEDIHGTGRARAIGVSNFTIDLLDRLLTSAQIVPAINQVELHPGFQQGGMRSFAAARGIVVEAWRPLGERDRLFQTPAVQELARKHSRTPAQIVLRWHLQLGHLVIPKTVHPERMRSNLDVFDFRLDDNDLKILGAFESGRRLGEDPDVVNE
ncbi:aldo/keto reductase [Kribbella speibonae]|uniref:Aldo/keto reductase n=1 Tax=Kribbella speibonae TaxID=1572660 RepID=A0A4R0IF89_9ACTN|nr:aldo/keto reductase [Kribbella speibonae]TCC30680.1 aldo/keto reductase [Kribbella speibonae]